MKATNVAERDAIWAAHPLETGRHDLYNEAMRLVGERHDKGDLVELVNWLLYRLAQADACLTYCRVCKSAPGEDCNTPSCTGRVPVSALNKEGTEG